MPRFLYGFYHFQKILRQICTPISCSNISLNHRDSGTLTFFLIIPTDSTFKNSSKEVLEQPNVASKLSYIHIHPCNYKSSYHPCKHLSSLVKFAPLQPRRPLSPANTPDVYHGTGWMGLTKIPNIWGMLKSLILPFWRCPYSRLFLKT